LTVEEVKTVEDAKEEGKDEADEDDVAVVKSKASVKATEVGEFEFGEETLQGLARGTLTEGII